MTYKLVLARRGIPTLTHCDQSAAARWQPISIVQHPRDYWRSFVMKFLAGAVVVRVSRVLKLKMRALRRARLLSYRLLSAP